MRLAAARLRDTPTTEAEIQVVLRDNHCPYGAQAAMKTLQLLFEIQVASFEKGGWVRGPNWASAERRYSRDFGWKKNELSREMSVLSG